MTRAALALGSGMKNCSQSKLSSISFLSSAVLQTPMSSYMTTHLQASENEALNISMTAAMLMHLLTKSVISKPLYIELPGAIQMKTRDC